ncbi:MULTISPECIES: hypothetical protein [Streptomyces]|uniref:hypothetical protein n=1 Tax=Streptomyces TaxID=1883 RepID=UPI000BF08589|nr:MULTISPECIES: hypothetical protein [Streptomyces]UPT46768.1 hypothetical protein MWG59_38615 [Streptomyces sp. WAC00303]WIY80885.1 hypothetical protein QPM16_38245 [Streptomyces anulatus]
MALTSLFTRRPAAPAPAPPTEAPEPRAWPEIGETWKPEGLPVAERYYNRAHAVVLVASTGDDPYGTTYYLVACLGCHFLNTRTKYHDSHIHYTLTTAAGAANDHAATCRALPRELPARPDESAARRLLHSWVRAMPRRRDLQYTDFALSDLDSGRLELQRTNEWIQTELEALAIEESGLLSARPDEHTGTVRFRILPQLPAARTAGH